MHKSIALIIVLAAACSTESIETDDDIAVESSELTTAPTTCAGDLAVDPMNCGVCGNVCASGLCYAGVCADDRAGHAFVVGHSYRASNPALDRVLGNAVFLREGTVNVVVYKGTAPADIHTGTSAALGRATTMMKRTATRTVAKTSPAVQLLLPTAHVLVIEAQPQLTDASLVALADESSLPMDDFVRRGGIVIVLDAPSAINHGTQQVLGAMMPMRRADDRPGAVAYVAAHEDIATGRLPLTFALGDTVGYAPSGYVDAITGDSGAIVVAHRAFY